MDLLGIYYRDLLRDLPMDLLGVGLPTNVNPRGRIFGKYENFISKTLQEFHTITQNVCSSSLRVFMKRITF